MNFICILLITEGRKKIKDGKESGKKRAKGASSEDETKSRKKQKKGGGKNSGKGGASVTPMVDARIASVLPGIPHPTDVLDMPVDPNEPTYCLCHQVSYGEMIGCDNSDVSFPFF